MGFRHRYLKATNSKIQIALVNFVLDQPWVKETRSILESFISQKNGDGKVSFRIFAKYINGGLQNSYKDLIFKIIKQDIKSLNSNFLKHLVDENRYKGHEDLVEALLETDASSTGAVEIILLDKKFPNRKQWIQIFMEREILWDEILKNVMNEKSTAEKHPEWLIYFVSTKDHSVLEYIREDILSEEYWAQNELLKAYYGVEVISLEVLSSNVDLDVFNEWKKEYEAEKISALKECSLILN